MSVAEFGNNVDEVRQKLQEILPLVDSGQEKADAVTDALEQHQNQLSESFDRLTQQAADVENSAEQWQSILEAVESKAATEVGEVVQTTGMIKQLLEQGEQSLRKTGQQCQQILETIETTVSTAGDSSVDGLASYASAAEATVQRLGEGQEQFEQAGQAVVDQFENFQSQWSTAETAAIDVFDTLESVATGDWIANITETFASLRDEGDGAFESIVMLLSENAGEVTELFADIGGEVIDLADDLAGRAGDLFGGLADKALSDFGETLSGGIGSIVTGTLGNFGQEIIENVATSQLGVATTTALAPVLPGIAAAKKVTGFINSIF